MEAYGKSFVPQEIAQLIDSFAFYGHPLCIQHQRKYRAAIQKITLKHIELISDLRRSMLDLRCEECGDIVLLVVPRGNSKCHIEVLIKNFSYNRHRCHQTSCFSCW